MKNAIIFGDSYSTFIGTIPQGYSCYYHPRPDSDVTAVEQMWWHPILKQTGLALLLNDSWSGATVGYISYGGVDTSESSSFLCRLGRLIKDGFFQKHTVDTVLICGGTNDSWSDAPLGVLPQSGENSDGYHVLPAIDLFLKQLRQAAPSAAVYFVINDELKSEIKAAIRECCHRYRMIAVEPTDIEKVNGHPTARGMKSIANAVLKTMNLKELV